MRKLSALWLGSSSYRRHWLVERGGIERTDWRTGFGSGYGPVARTYITYPKWIRVVIL